MTIQQAAANFNCFSMSIWAVEESDDFIKNIGGSHQLGQGCDKTAPVLNRGFVMLVV